jgi:hypothetical protein
MKTNQGSRSGICLSVCLSVCLCLIVLCLGLAPPAFAGLSRTDQETLDGPWSITVLKGDTGWFWLDAVYEPPAWIGNLQHLGDLEYGYWWPRDDEMTWTVVAGDFDDNPSPQQYDRHEEYYDPEGPPPPQAQWFEEKWKAQRTFTQTGHYQFQVEVSFSGDGPPEDPWIATFDVYVVEGHVDSVGFWGYLDQQSQTLTKSVLLKKVSGYTWNGCAFGDQGNVNLDSPEWVRNPAKQMPVCFVKGQSPILQVTISLSPSLQGAPALTTAYLQATSADPHNSQAVMTWLKTVSPVPGQATAIMTTSDSLPLRVGNDLRTFHWKIRSTAGASWSNMEDVVVPFWQTWASPIVPSASDLTAKRMDWATESADCAESVVEIAVAIQDALSGDPPLDDAGADENPGWALLDGELYGDCDGQAELMAFAVRMLGVQATLALVRGSNADGETPFDCLDFEHRWCEVHSPVIEDLEWLLLDFYGGGEPDNMNLFEGCCVVAGTYYAVMPIEVASSAYNMLVTLGGEGVTQHWCWWDEELDPPWWHPCDEPDATPDIP